MVENGTLNDTYVADWQTTSSKAIYVSILAVICIVSVVGKLTSNVEN